MCKESNLDPNTGKVIFSRTKPHLTIEQQVMQTMENNINFGYYKSIIILYCTSVLIMMKQIKHLRNSQRDNYKCFACEYETETGIIHMLIALDIRFYEKYDNRSNTNDGVILVVSQQMVLKSKRETYYFNTTSRYRSSCVYFNKLDALLIEVWLILLLQKLRVIGKLCYTGIEYVSGSSNMLDMKKQKKIFLGQASQCKGVITLIDENIPTRFEIKARFCNAYRRCVYYKRRGTVVSVRQKKVKCLQTRIKCSWF